MKKNYFKNLSLIAFLTISINSQAQDCSEPGATTGDTGCVTFNYLGAPTTLTTVRGADGKIWLQQNLGSTAVATSATDANAHGDLFQWGRWDDGHQLRNSTTSNTALQPNNPQGLNGGTTAFLTGSAEWWKTGAITDKWEAETVADVNSQNGCDPCKAIGPNWSLPTQADWAQAVSSEIITDIAKAFESNLKLTVSGSRTASGSFNFLDQRGYYWSNTTTTSTGFAKHLYYSNAIVNANSGSFRELGMSIRCLKASNLSVGDFTKSKFKLYPNPTSSIVTIASELEIEKNTIYNQIGQIVLETKATTIDLSRFTNGIYLIQTQFENGTIQTERIVKN